MQHGVMDMPYTVLVALAAIALILINIIAFAAFGIDKRFAESGSRRIPEATLLQLALFGGSPGAYAGRHVFRHKTRKEPFSSNLFHTVVVQVMAIGFAVAWYATG